MIFDGVLINNKLLALSLIRLKFKPWQVKTRDIGNNKKVRVVGDPGCLSCPDWYTLDLEEHGFIAQIILEPLLWWIQRRWIQARNA